MKKNEKKLNDLKNDVEAMSDDELNEVAGGARATRIPVLGTKPTLCPTGCYPNKLGKCVCSNLDKTKL